MHIVPFFAFPRRMFSHKHFDYCLATPCHILILYMEARNSLLFVSPLFSTQKIVILRCVTIWRIALSWKAYAAPAICRYIYTYTRKRLACYVIYYISPRPNSRKLKQNRAERRFAEKEKGQRERRGLHLCAERNALYAPPSALIFKIPHCVMTLYTYGVQKQPHVRARKYTYIGFYSLCF